MTFTWLVPGFALACVVLAGTRPSLNYGVQPAVGIAIVLLPILVTPLRRFVGAWLVVALGAFTIAFGFMLTWATVARTTYAVNNAAAITTCMRILGFLAIIMIILWARTLLPFWSVAAAHGTGMLATALTHVPDSPNPWKFYLSVPVSIIVLSIASRWHWSISAVSAAGLATVGVLNDSRSYAGFTLLAAAIVVFNKMRSATRVALNRAATAFLIAVGAVSSYFVATSVLVVGALGDKVAERTQQQLNQSGNLIVGGRPEWMATLNLMGDHPTGLGFGVMPKDADVIAAKEGLHSVGIPTYVGYVEHYMTAKQFKLHSIAADLWMACGWAGFLYAMVLLGVLGYVFLTGVSRTGITALSAYLILNGFWFILFSPIYSDLPYVAATLGLVILQAKEARRAHPVGASRHVERPPHQAVARPGTLARAGGH